MKARFCEAGCEGGVVHGWCGFGGNPRGVPCPQRPPSRDRAGHTSSPDITHEHSISVQSICLSLLPPPLLPTHEKTASNTPPPPPPPPQTYTAPSLSRPTHNYWRYISRPTPGNCISRPSPAAHTSPHAPCYNSRTPCTAHYPAPSASTRRRRAPQLTRWRRCGY